MMNEIQDLVNNKELLHKISENDKESPYEPSNNNNNGSAITNSNKKYPNRFPAKKVSIDDQPITTLYLPKKSPRPPARMINNTPVSENGRSPRMRRAAGSPMRTIRAIENNNHNGGRRSPRETNSKQQTGLSRDKTSTVIASPLVNDKVVHDNKRLGHLTDQLCKKETEDEVFYNDKTTEYPPPPVTLNGGSPVSSIASKASSMSYTQKPENIGEGATFENLPGVQIYGTSIQSFHTPSPKQRIKQRSQRPRIEDDIYDDIDIRKTPKGSDRVLINNNTPEDDVIDSPFQNNSIIPKDANGIMLEKESLNFASFCDSNNSLEDDKSVGRSLDCSIMTPPPPPIIDMEGHGCKCPKKLRCLLETGWFIVFSSFDFSSFSLILIQNLSLYLDYPLF